MFSMPKGMILLRSLRPTIVTTSCARRWMGRYSKMMDLGGAPSSMTNPASTSSLNLNKNCHLQIVVFDMGSLTKSMENEGTAKSSSPNKLASSQPTTLKAGQHVTPDVSKVEQVASLLNVNLEGKSKPVADQGFDDDLSLLTGDDSISSKQSSSESNQAETKKPQSPLFGSDIRNKYAAKLQKVGQSSASVDRSKEELLDHQGDAAFHVAARAHAVQESSTSWMAGTGTGRLLGYLSSRNMKVILIPKPIREPATSATDEYNVERKHMEDLVKQLHNKIAFHRVIFQDGSMTSSKIVQAIQAKLPTALNRCLLVSDRDDLLRAAKDVGMIVNRIRPPNKPAGNVSTHYTVATVPDTIDVINEINGISYSSVLQGAM